MCPSVDVPELVARGACHAVAIVMRLQFHWVVAAATFGVCLSALKLDKLIPYIRLPAVHLELCQLCVYISAPFLGA